MFEKILKVLGKEEGVLARTGKAFKNLFADSKFAKSTKSAVEWIKRNKVLVGTALASAGVTATIAALIHNHIRKEETSLGEFLGTGELPESNAELNSRLDAINSKAIERAVVALRKIQRVSSYSSRENSDIQIAIIDLHCALSIVSATIADPETQQVMRTMSKVYAGITYTRTLPTLEDKPELLLPAVLKRKIAVVQDWDAALLQVVRLEGEDVICDAI